MHLRADGMAKWIILAAILPALGIAANKYVIDSVGLGRRQPERITVFFKGSAMPPAAEAARKDSWAVLIDQGAPPVRVLAAAVQDRYPIYHEIALTVCTVQPDGSCKPGLPDTFEYITVVFYAGPGTATFARPRVQTPAPQGPAPAAARDESNLYVFGGINASVNADTTFTIDSFVDWHPYISGFGINAWVKTDNRPTVDPDSLAVKLDYVRYLSPPAQPQRNTITLQGVGLKFDYAGVEFDRGLDNLNFVSSPYIVLPIVYNSISATTGLPVWSWLLKPKIGIEAGYNFENALDAAGYGAFVRTIAGAEQRVTLRGFWGLQRIVLLDQYVVRLPNKAELYATSLDDLGMVYSYSRKARHYLSNSLNFLVNDYWGIAVTHEFGDLPPTFNFVDHKVSIGLTIMMKRQ